MKYLGNACEEVRICYIGGGSQGWAWKLMGDLHQQGKISGEIRLYDIDHAAAEANEAIGRKMFTYPNRKSDWSFRAVDSLREGLAGCDFVVISILPATFDEMESDVHAPEKYGVYQSVGDTTGPGGVFRAMRTIPMYRVIAEAIRDYAPGAWVINYTNPMGVCTGALYAFFPGIKAFGCCHEVFGTQRVLLAAINELLGEPDVNRRELRTNVLGVNHFTWITEASYKGVDLFPLYHTFVDRHYETGYAKEEPPELYFGCRERVKFDLFRRFNAIAAAGDRHLAEFMPEYLSDPAHVQENWGFMLTPVSYRKENKLSLWEKSRAYASGEREIPVEVSHEEGVAQMCALLGLGNLVTNVNLPNRGQLDVPLDTVVETNALFTKNSVRPVVAGPVPENLRPLLLPHMRNQQLLIQAGVEKNASKAYAAFCAEPMLAGLTERDKKGLFTEMFRNTEAYLRDYSLRDCF